jgi:hypothetical protein
MAALLLLLGRQFCDCSAVCVLLSKDNNSLRRALLYGPGQKHAAASRAMNLSAKCTFQNQCAA